LRAGEVRQLERRRGEDDRRCEQEREARRVLVREAHEQAAAHRRAGAREAWDERERLRGADERGVAPADGAGYALVVVIRRDRRAPAKELRAEEHERVEREEDGRVLR